MTICLFPSVRLRNFLILSHLIRNLQILSLLYLLLVMLQTMEVIERILSLIIVLVRFRWNFTGSYIVWTIHRLLLHLVVDSTLVNVHVAKLLLNIGVHIFHEQGIPIILWLVFNQLTKERAMKVTDGSLLFSIVSIWYHRSLFLRCVPRWHRLLFCMLMIFFWFFLIHFLWIYELYIINKTIYIQFKLTHGKLTGHVDKNS